MTLKKITINPFFTLITLLSFLLTALYFTSTAWGKYGTALELQQHLERSELLKTLEHVISNEIICTSKMSNNPKNLIQNCQKTRNETDIALEAITQYDNTSSFHQIISSLFDATASEKANMLFFGEKNLRKKLQNIRDAIDKDTNLKLNMLLRGEYQKQFIMPIHDFWEKGNLFGQANEKPYLSFLAVLSQRYASTVAHAAYGAYFLANVKAYSSKNFALWDEHATHSTFPDLTTIKGITPIKESLFLLFNSKNAQSIIEQVETMHIDMLLSQNSGKHKTTMDEWIKYNEKKLSLFNQSQSIVLETLKKENTHTINTNETIFLISIPVIILSILLLLLALKRYHERNKREEKALLNMMKYIETLTSESRKEIENHQNILSDFNNKESIYNYIGSILNLLHQKELQAADANATKDLFLANMSHEIRTPLNGILGFTQLLNDTELTDDQREFVTIIKNSSENLVHIVNDILDISKIRAGKIELEEIDFNVFEKIESAVETFTAKADEKNIELSIHIDPTLPHKLIGDPTKLTQVLINLVSNAVKFTPTHGMIDVYLRKISEDADGCSLYFGVKDSGIGISKKQKKKIFQAFTQADSSTNREFGGTGLGLTISSAIVEHMGGKLDVRSKVGEGTEFYFSLYLNKGAEKERTVTSNYKYLHIGIAMPTLENKSASAQAMMDYLTYLSMPPKLYSFDELINTPENYEMPDILFINHTDIANSDILKRFCLLQTQIVLMTTVNLKKHIHPEEHKHLKMVHKPMTLAKTERILLNCVTEENQKSVSKNPALLETKFENIHALIAEDNPINQKLMKVVLDNLGITTTLVSNGQEALKHRQENHYNIIFMDIQMPIMDGLEAAKAILEYETKNDLQHIPIIALTANALDGDRQKYIRAGMDGYASKPINLLELRTIIAEISLKN